MAIYLRTPHHRDQGARVPGRSCRRRHRDPLPTALLLAAFALGSLDEAIANKDGNLAMQSLSVLIGITIIFSVALTGFSSG